VHTGKVKELPFELQHGISHIAFTHIYEYKRAYIPKWISLQQELIKVIVLHASFSVVSTVIKPMISIERWETIKQKALLWSDLDKFGNVFATVDWGNGPAGQCIHDSCRLTLCNSKKLEQAKKRHMQKRFDETQSQHSSISNVCSPAEVPAAKRLQSNVGVIHDKTKCVWCCKARILEQS